MAKILSAATLLKLSEARQIVRDCAAAQFTPKFTIRRLQCEFGASFRYTRGTTVLRCASVEVTNTAGDEAAMLKAWLERTGKILRPQPITANPRVLEAAHG